MNKKLLLIGIVVLALVGSVYAQESSIILVSDNAADSAATDILAEKLDAEIVETEWGTFSSEALEQIQASSPDNVIIIGGTVAIPEEVESDLEAINIEVERLAGRDRYETASMIAKRGWGAEGAESAIVVQGQDDSGIGIARTKARTKILPILYVKKGEVPEKVRERLMELKVKRIEHISAPDTETEEIEDDLEEIGVEEINETARDKEGAALEAIQAAEKWIERAGELLGDLTEDSDSVAAYRLYEKGVAHLETAHEAYDKEKYGRAFGQATSAKSLARNSVRISEGIVVGDLVEEVEEAEAVVKIEGIAPIKERLVAKNIKVERTKAELRVRNRTIDQTTNESINNTLPVEPNLGALN